MLCHGQEKPSAAPAVACPQASSPPLAMKPMNKRITRRGWLVLAAGLLLAAGVLLVPFVRGSSSSHSAAPTASATPAASQVPGQKYQICNEPSAYLTSPWTYHALASGNRSYTVSQYKTLPGYGKTLPPLPSYIASESSATEAAVIYAPGSSVNQASVRLPGDAPALLLRGRSVRRDFLPDRTWRPVHRRVRPRLPRADLQQWRCGSGNRCPERYLRFLWRRQHPGVFGGDWGDNDHHEVAHQRLHWLADLRRWQDLPDLEGLGHHDHASLRADGRGERRPGGVRQSAAPDRLPISSGSTGRDIREARRSYDPASPLCQRSDRGVLLPDRGSFRSAERLLSHYQRRPGFPYDRWYAGLLRRSRR